MDFVNLREKYILTCYETGNKHATSIMEKTFKKKKSRTKFSLKQRESFYSPFLRSVCSSLPQSSLYNFNIYIYIIYGLQLYPKLLGGLRNYIKK